MIPAFLKSKFLLAALLFAVVTIPLSNNLNSIATILFVAACVVQLSFRQYSHKLSQNGFWLVPVVYFFWTACSYFWDSSGGFTIKELERYTIFLFIPPAMAMIPRISDRHLRYACLTFSGVTVAVCIICLVKAYFEYQVTGDYRVFYYQYLGEQMNLNAIFLSNYCLSSITWLLYFGFVSGNKKKPVYSLIYISASVFLMGMIFLLSSKLVIFLSLVIVLLFVLVLGYIRGFLLRSLLVIALIISAGLIAVSKMHYLSWRINTTELKMYSGPEDDQNGIAIRLFMWKMATQLIEERPLIGYGLRGGRIELHELYRQNNFDLGLRGNYHSHNQYLESALMAGVPATAILLVFIIAAINRAVKKRNFLLILIVAHFMVQSVFESTFEVQHELVFYIFFIFLFYYHAPEAGVRKTKSLV